MNSFPCQRFQHSKSRSTLKIRQKLHGNNEVRKILCFSCFLGHSWVFGVKQKSRIFSSNIYRMILALRQLNSMGETF